MSTLLHRRGVWALALVAGLVGTVLLVVSALTQVPEPPRLAAPVGAIDSPKPSTSDAGESEPDSNPTSKSKPTPKSTPEPDPEPSSAPSAKTPLGPSQPVSITIPAIDVRSDVFDIGKAPDGTLAVPQPGPNLDKAAWFENSPTPGQPGPSIIEGHVSTKQNGPSIFFDLAELRPGDTISVARKDGTTAVFSVSALREFSKNRFPTELIYGGEISDPTLRLITCSGFDSSVGHHTSNLIVFASLSKVVKT